MKISAAGFFSKKCALAVLCAILSFLSAGETPGAAGDLDLSFGVQGRNLVTISTNPVIAIHNNTTDIVVQPDGKILVSGYAYFGVSPTSGDDFVVLRFNPDGSRDASFANNGIFLYDFQGGSDELRGIALQPDGKIVAAGEVQFNPTQPNPNTAFAVIRLNPNGTFDSTFGTNGLVITDFLASLDQATEVAIQPDGKILASGWSTRSNTNVAGAYDFALARYNPNGTLDASFGTNGVVFTDFLGSNDLAQTSVLQPDGKIVLAGWVYVNNVSQYDFGLARYNPDGTLDATFGAGGKVVTPIGNNLSELVRGMSLAPDGKLVVAGDLYNPTSGNVQGNSDLVAVRYNSNGSLDATFDGDGKFIFARTLGDRNESGGDVVVQPDGKILLTGSSHLRPESVPGGTVSHTEMLTIRLNVNGSLDQSFGANGIVETDFGIVTPPPDQRPRTGDSGEAIALQPDGKIVVAGEAFLGNGDYRFVIARFLNDITSLTPRRAARDFDGDGKSDIAVFRPSSGFWYILQSRDGFRAVNWGLENDSLAAADYDGDGRTDFAVVRDDVWYILQSSNNAFRAEYFGTAGADIPAPADYDGDLRADLAFYHFEGTTINDNNYYSIRQSSNNTVRNVGMGFQRVGVPRPADYDGDGKTDPAIFGAFPNPSQNPLLGEWDIIQSSDNAFRRVQFGYASDQAVPADYDGDGRADLAVFRNGTWYLQRSSLGFTGIAFGLGTDTPTPADYDGDGKADVAVFRGGTWYLQQSTSGFAGVQFGLASDLPIPAAFR